MNVERLLRDLEARLAGLALEAREEVIDAVREEVARYRRRLDADLTIEAERERRLEAEHLREALEAIARQPRLEETVGEVLKQARRLIVIDQAIVALRTGESRLRVAGSWGDEIETPESGTVFTSPLTDALLAQSQPLSLPDLHATTAPGIIPGDPDLRSWCGLPLLVEGAVIGMLSLGRRTVNPFDEAELRRARSIAFTAAAALQKDQHLEQVRRYAALLEQVLLVDQGAFGGAARGDVAHSILDGAVRIGNYPGGLLLVETGGLWVAAAAGPGLEAAKGQPAPQEFQTDAARRLSVLDAAPVWRHLGIDPPDMPVFLVPFSGAEGRVGTLLLLDPDGESPDDRMMEAYASRAATAYFHARH